MKLPKRGVLSIKEFSFLNNLDFCIKIMAEDCVHLQLGMGLQLCVIEYVTILHRFHKIRLACLTNAPRMLEGGGRGRGFCPRCFFCHRKHELLSIQQFQ